MFSIAERDDSNRSAKKKLNFERSSNESSVVNKIGKNVKENKQEKKEKKDDKEKNILVIDDKKYFEPDKSLITDVAPKSTTKKFEKWELPLNGAPSSFTFEFKNIIIEFINYNGINNFFSTMNTKIINIYKNDVKKGFYYKEYNFCLSY